MTENRWRHFKAIGITDRVCERLGLGLLEYGSCCQLSQYRLALAVRMLITRCIRLTRLLGLMLTRSAVIPRTEYPSVRRKMPLESSADVITDHLVVVMQIDGRSVSDFSIR